MTRTFSYALPGSIYEVSPDYGMMTQAWNVNGYAVPIVEQFFGIKPNAANKRVVIAPQMPKEWEYAYLENVSVGDNEISIFFSKKDAETKIHVTQVQPGWEIIIQMPKTENSSFTIEGSKISLEETLDYYRISSKEKEATLVVKQN